MMDNLKSYAKTGAFCRQASRLFLPELRVKGGALYEDRAASESRPQLSLPFVYSGITEKSLPLARRHEKSIDRFKKKSG